MKKILNLLIITCFCSQIAFAAPQNINSEISNSNEILLENIHFEKKFIQSSNEMSEELDRQNQNLIELQNKTNKEIRKEIRDELPVPNMINIF
ncbi:hypothetical protein IJI31_03300 [bacterium]|nr:hypothetical protein [bacterium]